MAEGLRALILLQAYNSYNPVLIWSCDAMVETMHGKYVRGGVGEERGPSPQIRPP